MSGRSWSKVLCVALCLLWVPASLLAQTPPTFAPPNKAQDEILVRGQEAYRAQHYQEAAKFFEAALVLGELNVAYLNMGRARQKTGDCWGAIEAYRRVPSAPMTREPSPEQVLSALDRYVKELRSSCPGILVVRCKFPKTLLDLDGKPLACGEPVELSGGVYTLTAKAFEETYTQEITVVGADTQTVSIVLEPPVEPDPEPDPEPTSLPEPEVVPPTPARDNTLFWTGVGLGGAGVVGLLTGGAFSFSLAQNNQSADALARRDSFLKEERDALIQDGERLELFQWVSYGVGGALSIAGALLLLFEREWFEDEPSQAWLRVMPFWKDGATGATFGLNY